MSPVFNPPTIEEHQPTGRKIWPWSKVLKSSTVYRKDNVWVETRSPLWSDIKDADLVAVGDRPGGEKTDGTDRDRLLFLGGRVYEVSQAVADLLTAEGYSTT